MIDMRLIHLFFALVFVIEVLSNQCPANRNSNIVKSIAFSLTDSSNWRPLDMVYDSETDEYIYMGYFNATAAHFISRMDSFGNLVWGKAYNTSTAFRSIHGTLQYSSIDQALYYLLYTSPNVIVKANSSNGNIVNTYQISDANYDSWYRHQCKLSNDGQAYFCIIPTSLYNQYFIRFDTIHGRIEKARIMDTFVNNGYSVFAISNSEVFYSYRHNSWNHIVKANYVISSGPSYSFSEQYHQYFTRKGYDDGASSFGETTETIWHAICSWSLVFYFEYNSTDFSLIGNRYMYSRSSYSFGLNMAVGQGIVCIMSLFQNNFLLLINETTQAPIQMYHNVNNFYNYNLIFKDGYVNILGCSDTFGPTCYHEQTHLNTGLENLPSRTTTSDTFLVTTRYYLVDQTKIDYSMTSDTDPSSYNLLEDSYTIQTLSNESYAISLPNSLTHSLTGRPGQTLSLDDLPCKIDNYDSSLTCEVGDDPAPSWVTVDCANSQIVIQHTNESNNISDSFSIKSTYKDGEIISSFDITLVACDDPNCVSCPNGTCDTCITGYVINSTQCMLPQCGDGKREGNETCDDNNTVNGDGCSSDCSTIEDNYVCSGGSSVSVDICVLCNSGYYPNENKDILESRCGDGLKVSDEQCDDNDTVSGDGCNSVCIIETNYACDGGNPNDAYDVCTYCNNSEGMYQNDANNPTLCIPQCGDGKRAGDETCDDNNTVSDDGCSSDCSQIENLWVCSGGTITTKDQCSFCNSTIGLYPNYDVTPQICETRCGDGKRAGTEICDDNDDISGNGCSSDCNMIEDNYICSGGSPTSADQCQMCASGYYPNNDKDSCENECGDGLKVSGEQCDDNNTDSGDGCSSTCEIEASYVCDGGNSVDASDICTFCNNSEGMHQNNISNPTQCITQCGDGKRAGTETCDDGNNVGGNGCSSDCNMIEDNYVCFGGSPTSADQCELCSSGHYPNNDKDSCENECGDGLKVSGEQCDDNNTDSGDGCSPTCEIEVSYVCNGGNSYNASDVCTYCNNSEGMHQNDILNPTQCITQCGDGKRAGDEVCDDNNTLSDDGCNSQCTQIEDSWVCSGGNKTTKDVCQYCDSSNGLYRNSEITPEICIPRCNDSKRAGNESCDDGNNVNGDGCSSDCSTIEDDYVCSGGSSVSVDICVLCNSGYYPNENKDICESRCGDGLKVSDEQCDDNGTISGDGCSSLCMIEIDYACDGGNPNDASDVCTYCNKSEGMYQSDVNNYTQCIPQCGDGKRVDNEICDDNNTLSNDGCSSDCSQIEISWVCSGGTNTTRDECELCDSAAGWYPNYNITPQVCETRCGDGKRSGTEACDDGDYVSGNGCSSDCSTIEDDYVCSGGSHTSIDQCQKCNSGYYPNVIKDNCESTCGDGLKVTEEKCDDNNTASYDGCNSLCIIEPDYFCDGGNPDNASDACTYCNKSEGMHLDQINPTQCIPKCGDGKKTIIEACDDNNTVSDDGCSSDCTQIEDPYVCYGGTNTTKDECEPCDSAEGWYPNYNVTPQVCETRCGDGKRAGNEQCDDNNTVSGDGCSSECTQVEESWNCSGGTTTSRDYCTISLASEDSSSFHYGPEYDSTASTVTVQVAAGSGVGIGILGALLSGNSAQDAWAIINIIQLVLVLPFVVQSMSKTTINFIASNAFSALSVYYLPFEVIESTPLIRDLSFEQPDEYLSVLGWPSGSTLVNNIVLILILVILAIVHSLLYLMHRLTANKEGRCSSIIMKAYRFFTFTVYIRISIELYMFTMLMIVSEITHYIKSEGGDNFGHQKEGNSKEIKGNYVSLIISCMILILQLSFVVLTFISWKRNKDTIQIDETCKTLEFYKVIRKVPKKLLYQEQEIEDEGGEAEDLETPSSVPLIVKFARLYYFLFLIKRIATVLIVVIIPDSIFALKMSLILILQVLCILYGILIRSFANKKDQFVEIFNEIIILALLAFLVKYNSEEKWTDTSTYVFIGIILFQSCTLLLVSIISTIIKLIGFVKRCKNKCKKPKSEEEQEDEMPDEQSNEVEEFSSINDQIAQEGTIIPCRGNTILLNVQTYQDLLGEDRKESNQSHNKTIL